MLYLIVKHPTQPEGGEVSTFLSDETSGGIFILPSSILPFKGGTRLIMFMYVVKSTKSLSFGLAEKDLTFVSNTCAISDL